MVLLGEDQALTAGEHVGIFRVDLLPESGVLLRFVLIVERLGYLMTKDRGQPPIGEGIPLGGRLKQRVELHGFLDAHQLFIQSTRGVGRVDRDSVVSEQGQGELVLLQDGGQAAPEFLSDFPPGES